MLDGKRIVVVMPAYRAEKTLRLRDGRIEEVVERRSGAAKRAGSAP